MHLANTGTSNQMSHLANTGSSKFYIQQAHNIDAEEKRCRLLRLADEQQVLFTLDRGTLARTGHPSDDMIKHGDKGKRSALS